MAAIAQLSCPFKAKSIVLKHNSDRKIWLGHYIPRTVTRYHLGRHFLARPNPIPNEPELCKSRAHHRTPVQSRATRSAERT